MLFLTLPTGIYVRNLTTYTKKHIICLEEKHKVGKIHVTYNTVRN